MLYADDAGCVFKSAEGLAKMMTVIVNVFEAGSLTVYREEDEKYAAADTEPDTPHLAARHRRSRLETQTESAAFVPGRPHQRDRLQYACQRSNDGSDSRGDASIGSSWSCTTWKPLRSP